MAKRIFDDANHPHYGPVRRMWVMLAGLKLLEYADESVGVSGDNNLHDSWDFCLSTMLRLGRDEVDVTRGLLWVILDNYRLDMARKQAEEQSDG